MTDAISQSGRRLRYWWRKFVTRSRHSNIFIWLETALTILFLIGVMGTWLTFTNAPSQRSLLPTGQVALLLLATLIPAMGLLVLMGRRLALKRAAGSTARLHMRLVFFFSLVAAVPTLLVAGFAAILFQSGVDFWFSDSSRGLIANANQLAQDYYDENQREVGDETVAMAGDLEYYLIDLMPVTTAQFAEKEFAEFISFQMQGRRLNETVILQRIDDTQLRVAAAYDLTKGHDPTQISAPSLSAFAQGEAVFITANETRIEAMAPIGASGEIYLYNARNSEAGGFKSWENAKSVSAAYDDLTARARTLQLRFNLALFVVSLALVSLAIWFALRFADRQVEPVTELVSAAGKVGAGNFALRIEGRQGADEIGMLNRAFNRMTAQLEKQTDDLVKANQQIDDRRAFMEAVLESVSTGIISLDAGNRALLMNSSAQKLLMEGQPTDGLGLPIKQISTEIGAMLEAQLASGIVTHSKDGERLTLAVKIAPQKEGQVITFEDITQQLLDQRQAAWSDVARRVAHEIKNPLTPIQLATERLKRRYRTQIDKKDAELFDDLTATIVRQVGDLRKMVDEFSDFARLPKPHFRKENALDLVRQAVFLQEVAHPQIEFAISAGGTGQVSIHCDRHQLGQAMTNVLKNAVEAVTAKAAHEEDGFRGHVIVSLQSDAHMLSVTVEDNGVGLPPEGEQIIEPYVTTHEGGTGLGLAIVNKIVDEHRGDMSFSSGEGGSTQVTLRFALNPNIEPAIDEEDAATQ